MLFFIPLQTRYAVKEGKEHNDGYYNVLRVYGPYGNKEEVRQAIIRLFYGPAEPKLFLMLTGGVIEYESLLAKK